MKRWLFAAALLLLPLHAYAQQPISTEQFYRQIIAALAQETLRLGQENEQLKQQSEQQKIKPPTPDKTK